MVLLSLIILILSTMSIRIVETTKDNLDTFVDVCWRNDYYVEKRCGKDLWKRGWKVLANDMIYESFYHIILNDKVIGILTTRDKGVWWKMITMICIDEKYRSKGYGKQVVDLVKNGLLERHKELWLDIDVRKSTKNRLFKYYVSLGFKFGKINPADGCMLMEWKKN